MAATWSGSSDDSNEGDESLDDEDIMANFLAFASSHKSKSASEKEEESQRENDSSEDDSVSNSTNGYVEKEVLVEYLMEIKSLGMKTRKKIQRLREENLELSFHIDHLK